MEDQYKQQSNPTWTSLSTDKKDTTKFGQTDPNVFPQSTESEIDPNAYRQTDPAWSKFSTKEGSNVGIGQKLSPKSDWTTFSTGKEGKIEQTWFDRPDISYEDGIQLLISDHQYFTGLFDRLTGIDDAGELVKMVSVICNEIHKHMVAEESYLYPFIKKSEKPSVNVLFQHQLCDDKASKVFMDFLHSYEPDLNNCTQEELNMYKKTAIKLAWNYREHMEYEEVVVFPLVREVLDREGLKKLEEDICESKKSATGTGFFGSVKATIKHTIGL